MLTFVAMMIAACGCTLLIYAKKEPSQIEFVPFFQLAIGVLLAIGGLGVAVVSNPDHSFATYFLILVLASPLLSGLVTLITSLTRPHQSDEPPTDEKPKCKPAYWEPKKKKRGVR